MTQKRTIHPYNAQLKSLAKQIRNNSTFAEILLWNELKNKQIMGYDFHRQKPILNYIVDFFCIELNLAIEVDGITHDTEQQFENDNIRQKEIEQLGISFLRFEDDEIKTQIEAVVNEIKNYIENHKPYK